MQASASDNAAQILPASAVQIKPAYLKYKCVLPPVQLGVEQVDSLASSNQGSLASSSRLMLE